MNKKIIFVHIPKTAGSSFAYFLRKAYGKKVVIRDIEKFWRGTKTDSKEYESYDVIYGHFHSSKYMYLNGLMITFLRDPVERVISQFYYSNKPEGVSEDISLTDYAALPVCQNMMVKQLESLDFFDFIGFQEEFNKSLSRCEEFLGVQFLKRRDIRSRDNRMRKGGVTNKVKEYIRKMNKEDDKMYKMALKSDS